MPKPSTARLLAGLLAVAIFTVLFLQLAAAVHSPAHEPVQGVAALDDQVSRWMQAHGTAPLILFSRGLSHLHSVAGITVLCGLLGLLWRCYEVHWRWWLATLLWAVPGGMLCNVALKHLYQRARPAFDEPLVTLATYSFPSGHTVTATLFYGVLVAWAVSRAPRWGTRLLAVGAAAIMVLLVAFSRVYLGAHYPSDTLAAMLEGGAWLACTFTGITALRWRRAAAQPSTTSSASAASAAAATANTPRTPPTIP